MEFEWDEHNTEHIRGRVESHEAEEALADAGQVPLNAYAGPTEERGGVIGKTAAGRILVVIYTMREDRLRVVTAYPGGSRYERAYREANQ